MYLNMQQTAAASAATKVHKSSRKSRWNEAGKSDAIKMFA